MLFSLFSKHVFPLLYMRLDTTKNFSWKFDDLGVTQVTNLFRRFSHKKKHISLYKFIWYSGQISFSPFKMEYLNLLEKMKVVVLKSWLKKVCSGPLSFNLIVKHVYHDWMVTVGRITFFNQAELRETARIEPWPLGWHTSALNLIICKGAISSPSLIFWIILRYFYRLAFLVHQLSFSQLN